MIGIKNKDNLEPKIVLIDADSLTYFSSYGSEEDQILSEVKLEQKVYDILNIIEKSYNIEKYMLFVKGNNNFRYKIFPEYKKNRPEKHPIIDVLNKILIQNFNAIESHNAESDDYVYSYSQHPDFRNRVIICSVDKDLRQIPGIHYDYQKNHYHIVNEEEARYNLAIQMIMGDAADGVPGLKGYGIKKAEKIVKKGMSEKQFIFAIYREYKKVYPNENDAKNICRLYYKLLKLQEVDIC